MVKFSPFETESRTAAGAFDRLRTPLAMTTTITIITTMRGGYG